MVQEFLPLLRRGEHPRIVNVSSEAASLTSMGGGTPAYSASKAALDALTRMLAAELRPDRILVDAVCPGWVAADMGGPGGRPVADGAASVVWAATLPDSGPSGGFFRDGRPLPWLPVAASPSFPNGCVLTPAGAPPLPLAGSRRRAARPSRSPVCGARSRRPGPG